MEVNKEFNYYTVLLSTRYMEKKKKIEIGNGNALVKIKNTLTVFLASFVSRFINCFNTLTFSFKTFRSENSLN